MNLTGPEMQRLERDARGIATHGSLPYLADALRCLLDTRDPIAALALLSALWNSAHAGRGNQKSALEEAGQWLENRIRGEIDITPERLALELGWLLRLVTVHGEPDHDRGDGERAGPRRPDARAAPFGAHLTLLRDRRDAALARAAASRAAAALDAQHDHAAPSPAPRPERLPDIFAARFEAWQDAREAFKSVRKRRKEKKQPKERLLDVTPVAAELRHLAADLACSLLHTDGMDELIDHTGDLPTFWIAVVDLAPREGKRVPSRISFAPPDSGVP
jgi:hypothetical protein